MQQLDIAFNSILYRLLQVFDFFKHFFPLTQYQVPINNFYRKNVLHVVRKKRMYAFKLY